MTKDQHLYCQDNLDRIRRIEDYIVVGRDTFLESDLLQDRVIRSFEVIGEVAKRLDLALTAQKQQVTRSDFAGFRPMPTRRCHMIDIGLV